MGLIQCRHGLDDQQVRTGLGQRGNLFGKGFPSLEQAGLSQRLEVYSQRSDRSGDPRFARLLVFQMSGGLLRQPHSGLVDLRHAIRQPVAGQPKAVRAKGVGF